MELPDWIAEIHSWGWILFVPLFWVAYQTNRRLDHLVRCADASDADIDEIVEWLKEIDPRLEEEKRLEENLWKTAESPGEEIGLGLSAMDHMELTEKKLKNGERTLSDPLRRKWRKQQDEQLDAELGLK